MSALPPWRPGLEDVTVHAIPFPARREHRDRYVHELDAILRSLKVNRCTPATWG